MPDKQPEEKVKPGIKEQAVTAAKTAGKQFLAAGGGGIAGREFVREKEPVKSPGGQSKEVVERSAKMAEAKGAEKTPLQQRQARNRMLMQLLGAGGGGVAGYLLSRYLLEIEDTPVNLVAGGLGAGAGLLGASALTEYGKKETQKEETVEKKKQRMRKELAGGPMAYHLSPTALGTYAGSAVLGGLAVPRLTRATVKGAGAKKMRPAFVKKLLQRPFGTTSKGGRAAGVVGTLGLTLLLSEIWRRTKGAAAEE